MKNFVSGKCLKNELLVCPVRVFLLQSRLLVLHRKRFSDKRYGQDMEKTLQGFGRKAVRFFKGIDPKQTKKEKRSETS